MKLALLVAMLYLIALTPAAAAERYQHGHLKPKSINCEGTTTAPKFDGGIQRGAVTIVPGAVSATFTFGKPLADTAYATHICPTASVPTASWAAEDKTTASFDVYVGAAQGTTRTFDCQAVRSN